MQFTKQISHSKLHLKSVNKIPLYIIVLSQSSDITLTHMRATTHIKICNTTYTSYLSGDPLNFFSKPDGLCSKSLG